MLFPSASNVSSESGAVSTNARSSPSPASSQTPRESKAAQPEKETSSGRMGGCAEQQASKTAQLKMATRRLIASARWRAKRASRGPRYGTEALLLAAARLAGTAPPTAQPL